MLFRQIFCCYYFFCVSELVFELIFEPILSYILCKNSCFVFFISKKNIMLDLGSNAQLKKMRRKMKKKLQWMTNVDNFQ